MKLEIDSFTARHINDWLWMIFVCTGRCIGIRGCVEYQVAELKYQQTEEVTE